MATEPPWEIGDEVLVRAGQWRSDWRLGRVLAIKPMDLKPWGRSTRGLFRVTVLVYGLGGRVFDCDNVRTPAAIDRLANLVRSRDQGRTRNTKEEDE